MAAFSLIELIFVLGIAATLAAAAIPQTLTALDDSRAAGAARYLSTRLQRTRLEAITRGSASALRITLANGRYSFVAYVDGNANGVLSRDIQSGIDRAIQPTEWLDANFPGVDFGVIPGLPAVDPSSTPPGSDPIRLGSSDMATFTPTGTATPGSLYIHGRRNTQYVVRIFGETGKTRVLIRAEEPSMEQPLGSLADRRRARRSRVISEHGVLLARVRPGHQASIIDISSNGTLIETPRRLLPGSVIELLLETMLERVAVRGRVLRCSVTTVLATGIWYHGAVRFNRSLQSIAEAMR